MSTRKTYEDIEKLLKKHGQSHLLAFWDKLNADQRASLLEQINCLDLQKIDDWVDKFVKNPDFITINPDLAPASSYEPELADPQSRQNTPKLLEWAKN